LRDSFGERFSTPSNIYVTPAAPSWWQYGAGRFSEMKGIAMNIVGVIDLVSFLAILMALFFLGRGWHRALERDVKLLFTFLLILSLFHSFSNFLEWSGITKALDPFEDFTQILEPMLWGFFLYTFLMEAYISDRKKAEEALTKREKYYRSLISSLHENIMVIDRDMKITDVNRKFLVSLGFKREDVIGKYCYAVSHRYDKPCQEYGNICKFHEVFETGKSANCLHEHYNKDGSKFWVDILLSPIKDENGKDTHIIKAARNVSDIMEAKEELAKTESRLASILKASPIGIGLIQDNVFKLVNSKMQEITGYAEGELYGQSSRLLYKNDDEYKRDLEIIYNQIEETGIGTIDTKWVRKDGNLVDVHLQATPSNPYNLSAGTTYTALDITARKQSEEETRKLEEQLFHAQKMESIGRLAGGIAHDFNNILVGIMGYAELLKMKYNDPSTPEGKAAEVIFTGAERAADLTKQLLGFARRGKFKPVPLNINEAIEDTLKISDKMFEKNIKVKLDLEEKINTIIADKSQLHQVLTNLIINAKDAMPKGGELIFKTENIYIDENDSKKPFEMKPGYYAKLSITDSGVGMSKSVMEHIFEPFFTTKGSDKGTGLGLATVYGIIKNHDGYINVYSEPGEGSTFTLYFPVSEKEVKREPKISEDIVQSKATILIIDDEDYVREMTETMLTYLGYKVHSAGDGITAIKLF